LIGFEIRNVEIKIFENEYLISWVFESEYQIDWLSN
jgi:hypothetical protein